MRRAAKPEPMSWSNREAHGFMVHIPLWHPARVNELLSLHWASRGRRKSADQDILMAYTREAVRAVKVRRRVSLLIRLKPKQRGGDPDAYWKSLLDGLKHLGLLVDDSRTWCELAPIEYERGTAEDWGTVVTLEDLPAAVKGRG